MLLYPARPRCCCPALARSGLGKQLEVQNRGGGLGAYLLFTPVVRCTGEVFPENMLWLVRRHYLQFVEIIALACKAWFTAVVGVLQGTPARLWRASQRAILPLVTTLLSGKYYTLQNVLDSFLKGLVGSRSPEECFSPQLIH